LELLCHRREAGGKNVVDDSKDGCRRGKASVPLGQRNGAGLFGWDGLGRENAGDCLRVSREKAGTFMFICHSYHLPILIGPTTCAVDLP